VSPIEALTGASRPGSASEYDEAATAPISPPKASVTITASLRNRSLGSRACDGRSWPVVRVAAVVDGERADAVGAPLGDDERATVGAEGDSRGIGGVVERPGEEPSIGVRPPFESEKPLIPGWPLLRTYASSPCTAMLVGCVRPTEPAPRAVARRASTVNSEFRRCRHWR
jgi:hypothetical protein